MAKTTAPYFAHEAEGQLILDYITFLYKRWGRPNATCVAKEGIDEEIVRVLRCVKNLTPS